MPWRAVLCGAGCSVRDPRGRRPAQEQRCEAGVVSSPARGAAPRAAGPRRGSPSHSSASGAVAAGVPPRDARTLATIPHELLSPLPGRLRPAPSCVPCAGQECHAAVPEHGLFTSRRLSPQVSRVHGGLLCCLSSGQLRRGRPGRGPGRGTDAGRGGLRRQGCCVARGGWPGDLRWQFLGRGAGGRHQCVGRGPWHRSRVALVPRQRVWPGPLSERQENTVSRVSVRPQLPALWPLCPCAQLRPPCRRRGPSWGGRLLSSMWPPHVRVSRSVSSLCPGRTWGPCAGLSGLRPHPHGPALLPRAWQTPAPGVRPPVCWPSCPFPPRGRHQVRLLVPEASHSPAGSSAPDRVQTLQSPWSQLCEPGACDRSVDFVGAVTRESRHKR